MKTSSDKIVKKLVQKLETLRLSNSLRNESELEFALLPAVKKFIHEELEVNDLRGILYHHGRTKEEKKSWSDSKQFQNIQLLGTHTYDMLIRHPKIGSLVLEFKYATSSNNLTNGVQRIIGQSLIAKLRHDYVISFLAFRKKIAYRPGFLEKLKKGLEENYKIYLIVRSC